MRIIRNRQWVEDSWVRLEPNAPLPGAGDFLIDLERWNDATARSGRTGRCGLWLRPNEPLEVITRLEELELIAIEFPSFTDGRGYSLARLLRQRYGYGAELRAVGQVLRDQLLYLSRAGFDSFALDPGKYGDSVPSDSLLSAFDELDVAYQATWSDPRPLFRRVGRGLG